MIALRRAAGGLTEIERALHRDGWPALHRHLGERLSRRTRPRIAQHLLGEPPRPDRADPPRAGAEPADDIVEDVHRNRGDGEGEPALLTEERELRAVVDHH